MILQITVQQHHRIPRRDAHPAGEGALRAEIAAVIDDDDSRITSREFGEHFPRVVRTVVIDEDNLVLAADFLENGRQPLVHDRDRGRIPITDHDGADLSRSGTRFCFAQEVFTIS